MKKLIISIPLILLIVILFICLRNVLASEKSIYLSGEKMANNVSIRYDITITDSDIATAQQIDPTCTISSWTLDTGYGKTDDEAINYYSQGNTNNIEKPINVRNFVFNDQNGYDVLNSNGFNRVMLRLNFFGQEGGCQINYPIVSSPVLFSEFPYSYPGANPTPTP